MLPAEAASLGLQLRNPYDAGRHPLTKPLAAILQSHRERLHEDSQTSLFVFPSLTGGALLHRNVVSRGFAPAAELAGVEGVTFHSMRHAFASPMIFNGMEKDDLMRVMGHESEQALAIYTHLFNKPRQTPEFAKSWNAHTGPCLQRVPPVASQARPTFRGGLPSTFG